jgi:Leucine-rich repeat (LRR) protein
MISLFPFCLVYLLFMCCSCSSIIPRIRSTDDYVFSPVQVQALNELYVGTEGTNWDWVKDPAVGIPWNFSVPNPNPCTSHWQGIICNSKTTCTDVAPCTILHLVLKNYNLIGTLSSTIGNLINLEVFDLSNNRINGSIPSSVSDLVSLKNLTLSDNVLNGTIPKTLSQLTLLQTLNLSANHLVGDLFSAITNLTQLHSIDAHLNQFQGSIPSEISKLVNLVYLDLSSNLISGSIPSEFSNCRNLQTAVLGSNYLNGSFDTAAFPISLIKLDLQANLFYSTIPENIDLLRNLQILVFGRNGFHSTIPTTLYSLLSLTELDFGSNRLDGSIPVNGLGNLIHLELLDLSQNNFTGSIPPELSQLTGLNQGLILKNNYFHGSIPSQLCALTLLKALDFSGNFLNGTIPDCIDQMTFLTDLHFDFNYLSGSIPETLANLVDLGNFSMSKNELTGAIPPLLGANQPHLRIIDFNTNHLNGSIPYFIGFLYNLTYLHLASNSLSGKIPSNILNLRKVFFINMNDNYLTGPFPQEISFIGHLKTLFLAQNYLNGTLPATIGYLSRIIELDFTENDLSGRLPTSYCHLNRLTSIVLYSNHFTGPLLPCLNNISHATRIVLSNNSFSGPIPASYSLFRALRMFVASNNLLNGTLPADFINIPDLVAFFVSGNQFSGSMPTVFAQFPKLRFLQVSNNFLNGTIPFQVGNLESVDNFWEVLDFSHNLFDGSIPIISSPSSSSSIVTDSLPFYDLAFANVTGNYTHLTAFLLAFNYLTGSISENIGSLGGIEGIDFSNNYLQGPIPSLVCNLTKLANLSFSDNLLTGGIPQDIGKISILLELYLSNNFFSKTIPSSIGKLSELTTLYLSSNSFSGSLPCSAINSLRKASTLNFSVNSFTGTISNCFNQLNHLRTLLLADNQLAGNLVHFINSSRQLIVNTIDISSNQLTGTLPTNLFAGLNNQLLSFAVIKNCITGTIPEEICQAQQLNTLALDGLHSSTHCIRDVLSFSKSTSYLIPSSLQGSIPQCLYYALTKLETLHLSGNGLTGSLPDNINLPESLKDLSLSHNRLKGTIPEDFQSRQWKNFDLSFNKISGIISENISDFQLNNGSLDLEINRLSGRIPPQLMNLASINILKGNIFQCSNELDPKQSLPANDPDADSYSCGSDPVNSSLYLWLAIILISILIPTIVLVYALFFEKETTTNSLENSYLVREIIHFYHKLRSWWSVYSNIHESEFYRQPLDHIYDFGRVMKGVRLLSFQLTCFILFILLPVHLILEIFYHSYTYQYAYLFSLGYLSGTVPAALLLTLFLLFLVFIRRRIRVSKYLSIQSLPEDEKERYSFTHHSTSLRKYFRYLNKNWNGQLILESVALLILNCVVVLGIQLGFVFTMTSALSYAAITALALLLSGVIVFWNNLIVINLFSRRIKYLQNQILFQFQLINNVGVRSTATTVPWKADQRNTQGTPPNVSSPVVTSSYSNADNILFNEERRIFFLTHLLIFNNVLAPFVAAIFVSPNCFYYLLITPPEVTTSYNTVQCDEEIGSYVTEGVCLETSVINQSLSYIPPFFYSYQCSSNLLSTFISFYIYRYFFTGVFLPVLRICLKKLQEWYFYKFGADRVFYLLSWTLLAPHRILSPPSLMKGANREIKRNRVKSTSLDGMEMKVSDSLRKEVIKDTKEEKKDKVVDEEDAIVAIWNPKQLEDLEANNSSTAIQELDNKDNDLAEEKEKEVLAINISFFKKRQFLNRDYIVLPILSEFTVFITFGTIFPPLAIVVCYSLYVMTLFTQLIIGRIVIISRVQKELNHFIYQMNEECRNFRRLFIQAIPSISILASFFWGFFLFDILGDEIGSLKTLWILFVMGFAPIIIYFLESIIDRYFPATGIVQNNENPAKHGQSMDRRNSIEAKSGKSEAIWSNNNKVPFSHAEVEPSVLLQSRDTEMNEPSVLLSDLTMSTIISVVANKETTTNVANPMIPFK